MATDTELGTNPANPVVAERTTSEPGRSSAATAGWGRWGLALLLILSVVGFYALGLHRVFSWDYVRANLDGFQARVAENFVLSLAVFFAIYVAVTALSLPAAAILTLVAGALFGRWLGTGVVSIASTLGATLAFLSSRYVLRDWVQRRYAERLRPFNEGVEKDGAFYLLALRLVPAVPFFLVNLGMGLTRMRALTFAAVSWLGMLLGTFLFVNAGTLLANFDSPADLLSGKVLGSLALLGIAPLVVRKFMQSRVRWRTVGLAAVGLLLIVGVGLGVRTWLRYGAAEVMKVAVTEFTNAEYPDDPAHRSVHFGKYQGRTLVLTAKDATHFDFVFEPRHPHIAKIAFRNVDVSLMTPSLPVWTEDDAGLRRIALTDRQWNRQQVQFDPNSPHVEITGGDGFEAAHLVGADLAKNCLNAGLWEVLLSFEDPQGKKALYYHGWFTLPLGHYKNVFEHNTGLPYWKHWYYLEHWVDPAGTIMSLDGLRRVVSERDVNAPFDEDERLIVAGPQLGKRRIMTADNVLVWKDFFGGHKIRFATFIPPGKYSVNHPWKNEYWRMDRYEKAVLRDVVSPATDRTLQELELIFSSSKTGEKCRFVVSGVDLAALPKLSVQDYPKGLFMPMGIGVPPFMQSYGELEKNPPDKSPYFSVMLDERDGWIDHHSFGIDGPVMHRDESDPNLVHLYLVSYERHTLIAHFVIHVDGGRP